jgi:hypothetical protein
MFFKGRFSEVGNFFFKKLANFVCQAKCFLGTPKKQEHVLMK